MNERFKNWCRLCAKSEGCTKDVLSIDDSIPDVRLAIEKHFSLLIELTDEAPSTICDECHDYLQKLIEFEKTVLRSQSTFECTSIIEGDIDSIDIKLDISSYFEVEEVKDVETTQEEYIHFEFDCKCCGKTFNSESSLCGHMKSHTAPQLSCDICGTKFRKSFSLRNHRKLVHSNDRPFICDECGRGFKRSGDLTRHKEFHRDDTPFACQICDKRFKSKLVVKMHEKNHNSARYTCSICGQELKTKHTLRGHLLTHSNEMRFACKYCSKKFRYKKNLNCHLLTHTGLQAYSCAFCSQAFSLRWNCRTHQKKVHPVEVQLYEKEGKSTVITNLVKEKFACGRRQNGDDSVLGEVEPS